jgi:hypothetical protein
MRNLRQIIDRAAAVGCTGLNDTSIVLAAGLSDLELLRKVMQEDPPVRMTGFLVSTLFDQ